MKEWLHTSPTPKNWNFTTRYSLASYQSHIFVYRISVVRISKIKVKFAILVEGDPKAPFSIATTTRCRGGCYSVLWIAPIYPGPHLKMLRAKKSTNKYYFWVFCITRSGIEPRSSGPLPNTLLHRPMAWIQYNWCFGWVIFQTKEFNPVNIELKKKVFYKKIFGIHLFFLYGIVCLFVTNDFESQLLMYGWINMFSL